MRASIFLLLLSTLPLPAPAADEPIRIGIENGLLEPMGPPAPAQPPKPQPPIACTKFDLHGAVQFVGTACAQEALKHMDVNDRDVNGDTPLHNAIHFWNPPVIKLLLRAGADIHLRDFEGRNAIDLAWVKGHKRLYEFLTALERENERLLEAIENGDVAAVSNSLQRGATLGMRDMRLDTPLHRAAQSGLTDVGRLLIHHGANLEARNYLGETPLHAAALRGFKDFMKMLIEAGANVNALDERRNTPGTIAERQGNPEILAMLAKKKARRGAPATVEFDLTGGDGLYVPETGGSAH